MFKVKLVPTIVIRGTRSVLHFGLAIYIKKYLKATEEYNLPKNKSSKRNQNPSRCHNSITNLKFQHKPKISSFQKSSYKNTRPIIIIIIIIT